MVNIGEIIRSAMVGVLQPAAESRMVDTIRFTRPGTGDPVWNGQRYVQPEVKVYEGPCRIGWRNPAPQSADTTESPHAVDRTATVSVPVSDPATADIADGMRGVITAIGPGSAARVGMVVTVLTGHWQTDTTARRIPCEVVSRDAGPSAVPGP